MENTTNNNNVFDISLLNDYILQKKYKFAENYIDINNISFFDNCHIIIIPPSYNDNYKFKDMFFIYDFYIKIFIKYKKFSLILIEFLCKINRGNFLLKKYFNLLDIKKFLTNTNIYDLLCICCLEGTEPNFLFWYNKFKYILTQDQLLCLFSNSCKNSDDRIFKFLLNDKIINFERINKNDINEFFFNIINRPLKYILKD